MKKILSFILICAILTLSIKSFAEDSETGETCANAAGTVFIGKVTGHKYCVSNNGLTWWNAMAWCDAINMDLFRLDDCQRNGVDNLSHCPEVQGISSKTQMLWTTTPTTDSKWYVIEKNTAYNNYNYHANNGWTALCK